MKARALLIEALVGIASAAVAAEILKQKQRSLRKESELLEQKEKHLRQQRQNLQQSKND